MDSSRAPSSEEWDTSHLSMARREILAEKVSFEQLVSAIVPTASIVAAIQKPRQVGSVEERREFAQAVYRVLVPPKLFDLLYNGSDGLRGRYWQDPSVGNAATELLIQALQDKLIGAQLEHIGQQEWALSQRQVTAALEMSSAKIWVCEHDQNGVNLIDGGNTEYLRVARWEKNEGRPQSKGRCWRWTPASGHIDIKSALVNRKDDEWIPEAKRNRGEQIHEFGWT